MTTGNQNMSTLLQMDADDHRAIMEVMLYEILFPTEANDRIAAWIKEGCQENCEGYRIPDRSTHQIVTNTMSVYQQTQSSAGQVARPGPSTHINPPPGLAHSHNRDSAAGRTSNAPPTQHAQQNFPANTPTSDVWTTPKTSARPDGGATLTGTGEEAAGNALAAA